MVLFSYGEPPPGLIMFNSIDNNYSWPSMVTMDGIYTSRLHSQDHRAKLAMSSATASTRLQRESKRLKKNANEDVV